VCQKLISSVARITTSLATDSIQFCECTQVQIAAGQVLTGKVPEPAALRDQHTKAAVWVKGAKQAPKPSHHPLHGCTVRAELKTLTT